MTVKKSRSLRKHINDHCKTCIYDYSAAGTWRQQVTLCTVKNCALYPVRPVTKVPIPESVLDYYQVIGTERAFYGCSRAPEGGSNEHNGSDDYPMASEA